MTELPRDRWGRPLVAHPGGGDPVPYVRASGLGDCLDDTTLLTRWKARMAAVGVASRRDLVLAVNAHRGDKKRLDQLVEEALDAAQSSARATIGTAMHSFAETADRGQDPGYVPVEFEQDLTAYLDLTQSLFTHAAVETFCVCDELGVAGTPDRVSVLRCPMTSPDGTVLPPGSGVIADLKTSGSMKYGGIKFAVQLAVYAHAVPYTPEVGRFEWPVEVRTDWGLIIHAPAGEGTAELFWVDLVAGWELAHLAVEVRAARKRKGLLQPVGFPRLPDIEEWAS